MAKELDKNLKKKIISRYHGDAAPRFAAAVGFEKSTIIAPALTKAFSKAIHDHNFSPENDKVIDMGCGPFLLAMPLLRDGIHVDGVDITPDMITQAQHTLDAAILHPDIDRGAIQLATDYSSLAPQSYQFAMLNFVHQCCDTRESLVDLFTQANDLLKPGGRLVVMACHPDYLHVPHAAYACNVDKDSLTDGDAYGGNIYSELGRAAFRIEEDHYWSRHTVQKAAEEAGFHVRTIEDIEDQSNIARNKSIVPAYLTFTFSKPYALPSP